MMKKLLDIVGNRIVYACVLIVTLLLDTILIVHDYTGPFLKAFIVWGVVIIAVDFFRGKYLWRTKQLKWLIMFCIAYAITTVLNRESHFGDNIKTLAYMIVFFIILYGHNRETSIDMWKKQVRIVSLVYVWATAVLSSICLLTYIFSINMQIEANDGYMYVGMCENRLWGVYNPNAGACIAVIAIFLTLGLLMTLKKCQIYKKALLILNIIIQYVCMLLTGSRTSLYAFIICIGVLAFFLFSKKYKRFSLKTVKGWALNILVSVLVMGAVYGIGTPVKAAMTYVPEIVDVKVPELNTKKENKKTNTSKKKKKKVDLTRMEEIEDRDGGLLTGRTYIWNAGLTALKQAPVFGLSKNATYDYAKEYIRDSQWLEHLRVSLHNVYITVLVASGGIGFILFLIFIVLNIFPMLKTAITCQERAEYNLFLVCMIVVGCLLIIECFEARIIYRTEVFNPLFWTICGFAYNYVEIVRKREMIDGRAA